MSMSLMYMLSDDEEENETSNQEFNTNDTSHMPQETSSVSLLNVERVLVRRGYSHVET